MDTAKQHIFPQPQISQVLPNPSSFTLSKPTEAVLKLSGLVSLKFHNKFTKKNKCSPQMTWEAKHLVDAEADILVDTLEIILIFSTLNWDQKLKC